MPRKLRFAALAVFAGWMTVPHAEAAPPFPPYQCPWSEAPDCPRPSYCCLHYIIPSYYKCRAYHTPPRYVCGCPVEGLIGYRVDTYPCRISCPSEQAANYQQVGREPRPESSTINGSVDQAPK
jgi:hypothetical protein